MGPIGPMGLIGPIRTGGRRDEGCFEAGSSALDLADILRAHGEGLHVLVDEPSLAEALHGAGKGLSPIFYVTVGSGIGGGFIINGEIYRGVADPRGSVIVLFPYPEPPWHGSSPPPGKGDLRLSGM